jgi:hypothetical protein
MVQADVDGIVQGLGGMGGSTLGDLSALLSEISGNLYFWDDPTYGTKISWLADIDEILGNMSPALWSSSEYRSAADLLDDIRAHLNADGNGVAWWARECAYAAMGSRDYLSGYSYGPITETSWNTASARDFLSGYNYGPLTDIAGSVWGLRDFLSGYNGGPLTEIRDSLSIDGYSAAWWLQQIENRGWDITGFLSGYNGGPLTNMDTNLYGIQSSLYSGYWGASAADLLGDIRSHIEAIRMQTDQMTFNAGGRLLVETQ